MVVAVFRGCSGRRRAHSGQSLVEFALILPVLALLVLGAVDLTRAFYYYIALENASREAARVLIDFPYEYDDSVGCIAGNREGLPWVNVSCAAGTLVISPPANTGVNPPRRLPGRKAVTVFAFATFTPITPPIQQFTGGAHTPRAPTPKLSWY